MVCRWQVASGKWTCAVPPVTCCLPLATISRPDAQDRAQRDAHLAECGHIADIGHVGHGGQHQAIRAGDDHAGERGLTSLPSPDGPQPRLFRGKRLGECSQPWGRACGLQGDVVEGDSWGGQPGQAISQPTQRFVIDQGVARGAQSCDQRQQAAQGQVIARAVFRRLLSRFLPAVSSSTARRARPGPA